MGVDPVGYALDAPCVGGPVTASALGPAAGVSDEASGVVPSLAVAFRSALRPACNEVEAAAEVGKVLVRRGS